MKPLLLALALAVTLPAWGERLYVTNERAGSVQAIDTASDRVVGRVAVGDRPRGMALAPGGSRLYVGLSWWSDRRNHRHRKEGILVIDRKTLRMIRLLPAGTDPECVAITPDGKQLYLSNEDAGTASIIDLSGPRLVKTVVVGTEPEGVSASPDGRRVYVTAETSNVLSVIDTQKLETIENILVDARPRNVIFTRDSKTAWATAELGGTVMQIDVAKHRFAHRIRLRPGAKPVGLALSPDEKTLYIATGRGNGVAVIDTIRRKVVTDIPTGSRVWGIAITRDGRKVYAANSLSNTISVIDTATNKVVRTIATDDGPWALAMD